jgi:hypothetical protein
MEHYILTKPEADLEQTEAVNTVVELGRRLEQQYKEAEREALARKAGVSEQAQASSSGSGL